MKRLSIFGLVFIMAVVLLTSPLVVAEDIYVDTVVNLQGMGGSFWTTDVEIQNISTEQASVEIAFLQNNVDNSSATTTTVTIDAGHTARYVDALYSLFGEDNNSGAFRLTPTSGEVAVQSRTYYNDGLGGTFGQVFPGRPASSATGYGTQTTLIQLTDNGSFRSNVGLVNTTSGSIGVDMALYQADGTYLTTRSDFLPPFGRIQLNRIFYTYAASSVDDGYVVLSTSTVGGAFLTFASVVDSNTGDAVTVLGSVSATTADPVFIPSVEKNSARFTGAASTDLEIKAAGGVGASVTVAYLPTGQDNSSPATSTYSIPANQALRLTDLVESVFSSTGPAAVMITPTAGEVEVNSITKRESSGDFFYGVPGQSSASSFAEGQVVSLIMLTRSSTTTTDLGLLNTSAFPISLVARQYDATGQVLGTSVVNLAAQGHLILSDVLGSDVADAFLLVKSMTANAKFMAWATVTDTSTGDAIYIPGHLYQGSLLADLLFMDGFESGGLASWSGGTS